MKNVTNLAISWFIWGLSFYLYYPFVSLFAVEFLPDVVVLYLTSTIFAIPLPLVGGRLSRKIGLVKTMKLGGVISGIGLILVAFSQSAIWLIISYTVTSGFFLGLPSYYSYMNSLGKGTISRVWTISILPSFFTPYIGGVIASVFGLRSVFFISGMLMTMTALPLITLNDILAPTPRPLKLSYNILIPIVVILPIGLTLPFVFLELHEIYSMSYEEIGELATISEIIGAIFTYLYSRFAKKYLISIYLFIYSLVYLLFYNPLFSVFFGLWEAIIPSTLEESNERAPESFAIINSFQQVGWLISYIAGYLSLSPKFSLFLSSILAVLIGVTYLFLNRSQPFNLRESPST